MTIQGRSVRIAPESSRDILIQYLVIDIGLPRRSIRCTSGTGVLDDAYQSLDPARRPGARIKKIGKRKRMSSLASYNFHFSSSPSTTCTSTPNDTHPHPESHIYTPQPLKPTTNHQPRLLEPQRYHDALAQLQYISDSCMNGHQQYRYSTANPDIQVQQYTSALLATGLSQDALFSGAQDGDGHGQAWFSHPSMGGPSATTQGLIGARSGGHQRTPSASTVASNGPASPYAHTYSNPHVANTDFAPNSPAHHAEQQSAWFQKNLHTQTAVDSLFGNGYVPSQAAHTGAHQAMRGFAIDHHTGDDFAPGFAHSEQGMSSNGYTSPDTPNSGVGESSQAGQYSLSQNGESLSDKGSDRLGYLLSDDADYVPSNPDVQLFRTDSQAYQDELYNPDVSTSAPVASSSSKPANNFLSPHRGLIEQRLQTANMNRSQSPNSAVSRDRSPFRTGSPLAPTGTGNDWPSQITAASMRQQQKEQADRAEITRHQPQLTREPTKTISPKDALLDYNDTEQSSLFQDTVPAGYRTHNGGTQLWPSNDYQPGGSFGSLQTPSQQHLFSNFRATPADGNAASANAVNYVPLPPQDQPQLQNGSFLNSYLDQAKMESNPEFPANLTRMESSLSDNGPSASQESAANGTHSAPRRPADTRAGTGTYTCTYHGCTQRFDSHQNLQKHKREYHRSQQPHLRTESPTSASPAAASASPRSSESPEASSSGMTSAALMARNSQAGPHKCTRINPSTNKPCNTIFSRPYDLTRHEDTIHNNRKQKVRCPMCREEKTFSRNDALTRHMRVVHPEVESYGKRSRKGD